MPKVSDAHRASRRDQILDAAMQRFTAQGIQTTTMADIISSSGLSAGAIYGYFAGKQELAVAVAKRTIGVRVKDLIEAANTRALSPSAILRILHDGFDRDEINPGLIVQLWGVAASDPDFHGLVQTAFTEMGASFHTHLEHWARHRGLAGAEAEAWAARTLPVMMACGQSMILQRALMPGYDREAFLASVAASLD